MTPRSPARQPLKVAILGLGTVGGAVAEALMRRGSDLAHATGGRPIHLAAVGVRDPERTRAVEIPRGIVRSADLAAIASDPAVDVVVELLGGLEPAGDLIADALRGGRSVVTANKALLARRGAELEAEARRTGAALRFEAAVGGGVPVLGPLGADLSANHWTSISGIVNGTTNYILTAMTDEGWDYGTVLSDAQARGYAEADPSGDVEGRDAADKLAILVRLAFGDWPDVTAIRLTPPTVAGDGAPGITGVTAETISAAAELELVIKLVAYARRSNDGVVGAAVLPVAIPAEEPFARIGGVTNVIELVGDPIGRLRISGPGAGGGATSSAVLGDLIAIARGHGSTWAGLPMAGEMLHMGDPLADPFRWFIVGPDGGSVTEPLTLSDARKVLAAAGDRTALYPVLEG
ncbi:MAG: homoserine dehydrogenase [Candidatus Limnocylindrales bacterium]